MLTSSPEIVLKFHFHVENSINTQYNTRCKSHTHLLFDFCLVIVLTL